MSVELLNETNRSELFEFLKVTNDTKCFYEKDNCALICKDENKFIRCVAYFPGNKEPDSLSFLIDQYNNVRVFDKYVFELYFEFEKYIVTNFKHIKELCYCGFIGEFGVFSELGFNKLIITKYNTKNQSHECLFYKKLNWTNDQFNTEIINDSKIKMILNSKHEIIFN